MFSARDLANNHDQSINQSINLRSDNVCRWWHRIYEIDKKQSVIACHDMRVSSFLFWIPTEEDTNTTNDHMETKWIKKK